MSEIENSEVYTLPEILPPKDDMVFKMLFGDKRNTKILVAFLEAILETKINDVALIDPILKKENEDDKLSILDVKAELENGEIVDIEMQARNLPDLRQRITYYSAGMIREQIGNSGKYTEIKPVISIIIVAKSLILESEKCHNVFSMLEKDEHFPFNNLQEIHILDLSRIEKEKNETLSDWLRFINSEKEEDFMRVAQKDKTIKLAFGELKILSADKSKKMIYEAKLKQQRDIWSITDYAEKQVKVARQEGRQQGMQEGRQQERQEIFAFLEDGHSLEEAKKKFAFK
jgi:predicted transposase/invertase (TIGR01784 family)